MATTVTRREFLTLTAAVSAAGCAAQPQTTSRPPGFRTLGRTGLQVSEVGMGVMLSRDPALVGAALDAGVNYFDTARSYMGGRNEAILAEGLGDRRQRVIVATKCHHLGSRQRVVASVEQSLRELRTDYIDVLQLHGLSSRQQVVSEEHQAALAELRQSGKIRFAGVTTHSNMVAVMDAAVEAGSYDVVLTSLNFKSPPEVQEAVERTAAAGLGVVAMKVMTGGYISETVPGLNPYQSALRWVLQRPGVATTIPSMATFEQVLEDTAVSAQEFTWQDSTALRLYDLAVRDRYCRGCGSCGALCPRGTDLPGTLRGVMYAEGYSQPEMGRRALKDAGYACEGCSGCSMVCRFGVDLPRQLAVARELSDAAPA